MYTRARAPAARAAAAALGRQPMGPARGDRRLAGGRPDPGTRIRSRWRPTRRPTRGSRGGWSAPASRPAHELIVVHVSAGNPFRRWPEPAFVGAGRRARGGLAGAADRAQLRSVGSRGGGADRGGGPAGARRRGGPRSWSSASSTCAELRALVERSRLFVGGDTGPLHIAATTATPIVGIYGPTESARSAPWRDPRFADRIGGGRRACRAGRAISGSASLAIFDV